MKEEEFKHLLLLATEEAKQFALKYIENELPANNVYNICLNLSHDDPKLTQFDLYSNDEGKILKMVNVDSVISTLLRNGKVPVWIDISVSEIKKSKTLLTLLCAGRYSDNINELYYYQQGLGPFGVKSPNLPIDYTEGVKFKLPQKKISFWKTFFGRNHS